MGKQLQDESRDYEPNLTFDWQQSYDHYLKELGNKEARIIVAIDPSGVINGYQYSYMSTLDYLAQDNRECTLEALYVKPEYRNKGIAKALVQDAEQWAITKMKASRIRAGIYTGNTSSEIVHIKNGFNPYYTEYIKLINTSE